jgi:hypothetical protein
MSDYGMTCCIRFGVQAGTLVLATAPLLGLGHTRSPIKRLQETVSHSKLTSKFNNACSTSIPIHDFMVWCLSTRSSSRFCFRGPNTSIFSKNKHFRFPSSGYSSRYSGIALGYGLDDRGPRFRFLAGLRIFLFTTASRTALGPTQPPIQWVPEALSLGVKWPGREADHPPPSSAEVKEWVGLHLHYPIRFHGVVLS